jgi:hypothetical protein
VEEGILSPSPAKEVIAAATTKRHSKSDFFIWVVLCS